MTANIEQLLYQIKQAIRETRRIHPGFKVVIELAVGTHADIQEHLYSRSVRYGDDGPLLDRSSDPKLYGCEVDLKPDWTWGAAVLAVDEEDDGADKS